MSGHTPGPWSIVPAINGNLIQGADGSRVVRGQGGIKFWADARLIAAAPELFEAARIAVESVSGKSDGTILGNWARRDRQVEALDALRAAIAKAEGTA